MEFPGNSGSRKISVSLVQCPLWNRNAPPLAISLLAGNLRSKGYKVSLFDLNNNYYHKVSGKHKIYWDEENSFFWASEKSVKEFLDQYKKEIEKTVEGIAATGSKLVGFSVPVYAAMNFSLEIAYRLKRLSPETIIVFGGACMAEYVGGLDYLSKPFIDAAVLREGDITLPEVCRILEGKEHLEKIPGLVFKRNGELINGGLRQPVRDLDSLPFADYSDFDFTSYANPGRIYTFSSRSCINKCHFCNEWKYMQKYRYRSGRSLFEEVKHHMTYNPDFNDIIFADSLVNGSLNAMREFSGLLIEHDIKITWAGQAAVRKDMDAGLLKLMGKAGCRHLGFGIETGSEKVLKSLNKSSSSIQTAEQNLRDAHNAGIKAFANFMFGYPTETEEDFIKTMDFVRRNSGWIDGVTLSTSFFINPGTYLYDHLEEFGLGAEKPHRIYWRSKGGENTYPERFSRYERFSRLCIELGIQGFGVDDEKIDKWKLLGEYYFHIKDYKKAAEHYELDLIKSGYSFDSANRLESCRKIMETQDLAS